jgi:NAD(P)-dependent dehydrogenase (short-subunit alcohol dehydrogenase family)
MRVGPETPAVVTGGASGLGAATARALAQRGAKVALLDRDFDRGAKVAGEIHGLLCEADVADPASVEAALERAEAAHGVARIAVACAGVVPAAKSVDRNGRPHDPGVLAQAIAVNLLGTIYFATQAAARMAAAPAIDADGGRGVIVATASVAAYEGQIGQLAYAASKGGIAGAVLPMARDLASVGIRVMAIAPGIFLTPMLEGLPGEVQESLGKQVPFPPRLGEPSEFAALVVAIAGNQMLNGSVIRLDGAIRMGPR